MQRNHSQTILVVLTILTVAFALVPSAWAATEQTLYAFKSSEDGDYPNGGLIMVKGRIYGTTMYGGAYGQGTVYELSHAKAGWVKTTLHDFSGLGDGGEPWSGVVADRKGNLYGTAPYPDGAVFKMSREGNDRWQYEVIHTFNGNGEGLGPIGGVIVDDKGNLYGATGGGGKNKCGRFGQICGIIFELSPSHAGWNFSVLFQFDTRDGWDSLWPLYRDSRGNLYGIGAVEGGLDPCGITFELSPSDGTWNFHALHKFRNEGLGICTPNGALIMGKDGSLYGTTNNGGGAGGNGVVYRLTRTRGKWVFKSLYEFPDHGNGTDPSGGAVLDSEGNLYGATDIGGQDGWGTVFEVSPSGKGWKESVLFSFNGYDGNHPQYGLSWGKPGELIGATEVGGSYGYGAVYAVRP
jgi:uncharacterized repeat protein (TIGR03803 family)